MGVNFDYKRDEKKNRYDFLGLLGPIIITAGSALALRFIYLFIYLFSLA